MWFNAQKWKARVSSFKVFSFSFFARIWYQGKQELTNGSLPFIEFRKKFNLEYQFHLILMGFHVNLHGSNLLWFNCFSIPYYAWFDLDTWFIIDFIWTHDYTLIFTYEIWNYDCELDKRYLCNFFMKWRIGT